MSDFAATYALTRGRFDAALEPLTQAQLKLRTPGDTMSIGQMAMHVAGVEFSCYHQLMGMKPTPEEARIALCATEGAVNNNPFPFTDDEITPELVRDALVQGRRYTEELLTENSPEIRARQMVSALGPVIDGVGAFVRLSAHPFYHQGQIYQALQFGLVTE